MPAPTVTLPLANAGIVDARESFAARFFEALRAGSTGATPGEDRWLHGVSAPAPGAGSVSAPAPGAPYADRARSTAVLVVPGLFGDCFDDQSVPFGDGALRTRERSLVEAYLQYADLGLLGIRALSLPGRRTSVENGPRVAAAIREEAARPGVRRIVIVAFSKGVPDTLHALDELQATGGLPPALTDVVSVAGVVMGTPVADHAESVVGQISPWFNPFECTPSDGQELSGLTRRERVAWLAAHPLPPSLHYYSIVAYAPPEEISPALRPLWRAMGTFDRRNDGQVLASDAILPRSTLLAEARADHWDVALPRDRHPHAAMRLLASGRNFPREALFRATIRWVVGGGS